MTDIYELLRRLGVTSNYTGYQYTACAVKLCAEEPERLLLVTKWVYPDVAKRHKTNWKSVERNIRTVGSNVWKHNRSGLEELAGRSLPQRPRTAQFLAILTSSLLPPLPVNGLGESVTLTGEDDDVRVMDEPVNECCRETVVPEDGVPLAELEIGGNNEAPALIAV